MGPPGSDQMRKARYFEYAKVCFISANVIDAVYLVPFVV